MSVTVKRKLDFDDDLKPAENCVPSIFDRIRSGEEFTRARKDSKPSLAMTVSEYAKSVGLKSSPPLHVVQQNTAPDYRKSDYVVAHEPQWRTHKNGTDILEPGRVFPKYQGAYFTINEFHQENGEEVWNHRHHRLWSYQDVMEDIPQDRNVYTSVHFFHDWGSRTESNVKHLTMFYLDLDVYKLADGRPFHDSEDGMDQMVQNILTHCDSQKIPRPSVIIFSGRGIYLKWYFEQLVGQNALRLWKRTMNELVGKFTPFNADQKAKDAARFLRVTGSINQKTGQQVRPIWTNLDSMGNVVRFNFNDLCDSINPHTLADIKVMRDQRMIWNEARNTNGNVVSLPAFREPTGQAGKKRGGPATATIRDIETIIDMRFDGRVPYCDDSKATVGPDIICHALASTLAKIVPPEEIIPRIEAMARVRVPMSYVLKNLRSDIGTIVRRAHDESLPAYSRDGKTTTRYYNYSRKGLIRLLDITEDEQKHLSYLVSDERATELKRVKDKTYQKARRQASGALDRETYTKTVKQASTGRKQPWKDIGVSKQVYYAMTPEERLHSAVKNFPKDRKLTQDSLMEYTGVSRTCVKKYWKIIQK